MKNIKLFGDIANTYKAEWSLCVETPAEALRAINANRPGFSAECDKGNYIAILVNEEDPDASKQITTGNCLEPWSDQTLYVVPKVSGEITAAIVGGIIGLAATNIVTVIITLIINIAISIAISAIATLISGTPDGFGSSELESPENKPSYLFNGVVNTAKQGHRIPVLYGGPLLVGSMVLSARTNVKDIPV